LGSTLATVEDAISSLTRALRSIARASRPVEVSVREALGRLSASTLLAPSCSPRYPISLLDGCAVDSGSVGRGSRLRVAGRSRPGSKPGRLPGGEYCVWVDTGAPLPVGADSVVPVEELEFVGTSEVVVKGDVEAWRGVAFPCSDVAAGDPLVYEGEVLTLPTAASAASLGVSRLRVYPPLKACVGAVGDELEELEACGEGRVCEVNRMQVSRILSQFGVEVEDLGIIPDDPREVERAVERAVGEGCRLVILSGGSSVGLSDYTAKLVERGASLFTGLALRPGRPTKAVLAGSTLFIALPGHPRSAHSATTEVIVRAMLSVASTPLSLGAVEARLLHSLAPGRRLYKAPLALIPCAGDILALPVSVESYMTASWGLADAEASLRPGSSAEPLETVEAFLYRWPPPTPPLIDAADTRIIGLGSAKALKIDLARREEVLSALARHGCPGLTLAAEITDIENYGVKGRLLWNFKRRILALKRGGECSKAAAPALPSTIKGLESLGAVKAVVTPRAASAVEMLLEGYVDCAVAPMDAMDRNVEAIQELKIEEVGESSVAVVKLEGPGRG
jgi:molybdopterin molybdotransferase